ncbi:MAG: hypothetical protein V5A57_00445 [Candidatus Paceibacterota bacterium]
MNNSPKGLTPERIVDKLEELMGFFKKHEGIYAIDKSVLVRLPEGCEIKDFIKEYNSVNQRSKVPSCSIDVSDLDEETLLEFHQSSYTEQEEWKMNNSAAAKIDKLRRLKSYFADNDHREKIKPLSLFSKEKNLGMSQLFKKGKDLIYLDLKLKWLLKSQFRFDIANPDSPKTTAVLVSNGPNPSRPQAIIVDQIKIHEDGITNLTKELWEGAGLAENVEEILDECEKSTKKTQEVMDIFFGE